MTICMIIFTISMRVILNIQSNNNLATKQRAIILDSHDRIWEELVAKEVGKVDYFEDGNLILQSDTSVVDSLPDLELVSRIVKLKDGRIVQKTCFYVHKRIQSIQ